MTDRLLALIRRLRRWADLLVLGCLIIVVAFLPRGLPVGVVGLGMVNGASIALQAMGLVLLYRATRVINFAQTVYGVVPAVVFYQFVKHLQFLVLLHGVCHGCVPVVPGADASLWNLQNHPQVIARAITAHHGEWLVTANFWLSAVLALLLGMSYARSMGNWTSRFWSKAPRLIPTVASLGLATVLVVTASTFAAARLTQFSSNCFGLCSIDWKPFGWWPYDDTKGIQGVFRVPYGNVSLSLPFDSSHAYFHVIDIAYVVLALVAAAAIMALLRFTRLGIILRGVADNPERAQTLGVDINRNIAWVWLIGGGLSTVVALIAVTANPPNPTALVNVDTLTRMLAVAVFARMASVPLVMTAAFGLSIIDEGLFWNFSSHAPFFLVQLGIIGIALLLQNRRRTRAELESAVAWLASPEIRPTPRRLRQLPLVRNFITWGSVLGVAAVIVLPFFLEAGQVTIASIVLVYTMVGLSVLILTGWAGQISLGQFGFAAIGGFVSIMLYTKLSLPLPLAALAGALAGAAAAVIVGFPGLRLPGPYLAVVTLAVAVVVAELLVSPTSPSLGAYMPRTVDRPLLLGLDLNDERIYYYAVLAALALTVAMVVGMRRSRMRRALIAARDNEPAAQAFGINVVMARLEAFAVAGFLAALAGVFLAFEQRGVKVSGFDPNNGILTFLVVVIGGIGSLAGPLIAAVYYGGFSILGEAFATTAVGIGVIWLLIAAPDGLGGLLFRSRDAILRRMAIRNRISAPSLLADFTSNAAGVLRARIRPSVGRDGGEEMILTRFELTGGGPGPVAGTYLALDGARALTAVAGSNGHLAAVSGEEDPALLSCRQVEVHFDAVQALFQVDLDVRAGEIVALVGTNGAGKTTLLRAIAGLHAAGKGAVAFEGQDITHTPPHLIARKGIAAVPGGAGVFPSLTVAENLRTAAWQRADADIEQVLGYFPRLSERLDTRAGNLSGGEQQMLAIAQAFLVRPRLLLIDELSLGLAPQVVQTILDVLRELREDGTGIVIVEQSLNLTVTIADRAVVLEKGTVQYTGPARELLAHPELFQAISFGSGGSTGVGAGSEVGRRRRILGEVEHNVLEVRGISGSYGGVRAVQDVNFALSAGEVAGIIGPNGAGKTTLFDLITGFHMPDAGSIAVLGTDVTNLAPYARANLGLMRSFQNVRLFPSLTVRDNIAAAMERHVAWKESVFHALWLPMGREAERKVQARVDQLVELLGLGAQVDRTMAEISVGTRRIVDIACQLAARPRVLLLDEPSSGLAQVETEQLGPIIARMAKDLDAAILVIEHDIPLISAIANRLIALELGAVIAEGAPQEVLADPRVRNSYFGGAAESVIARSGRGVAVPA
ncbi:MAG: ATP-binding cassette domain-containing protein [Candidatus Dormibacteria bacterium]